MSNIAYKGKALGKSANFLFSQRLLVIVLISNIYLSTNICNSAYSRKIMAKRNFGTMMEYSTQPACVLSGSVMWDPCDPVDCSPPGSSVRRICFFSTTQHLSFSHVRLRDHMDCSLPGSSVCGILQARILEWVAIPFSRGEGEDTTQSTLQMLGLVTAKWHNCYSPICQSTF